MPCYSHVIHRFDKRELGSGTAAHPLQQCGELREDVKWVKALVKNDQAQIEIRGCQGIYSCCAEQNFR